MEDFETFKVKPFKSGNISLGVIIPKNLCDFMDLKEDEFIEVGIRKVTEPTPEPKENAVKTDYGDRFKVEKKEG